MTVTHPSMCACGLPFLLHPDVALQTCGHCDVPHRKLHPSQHCVECERLHSVGASS